MDRKSPARVWLPILLCAAVVLLKSVPRLGAAPPWCAAVDALVFLLLLRCAETRGWLPVLAAALFATALDHLQGTVPVSLLVSLGAGNFLATLLWRRDRPSAPARAALSVLTAVGMQLLCIAAGYLLRKHVPFGEALRTAVRSRWVAAACYAVAGALLAQWKARREKRRVA